MVIGLGPQPFEAFAFHEAQHESVFFKACGYWKNTSCDFALIRIGLRTLSGIFNFANVILLLIIGLLEQAATAKRAIIGMSSSLLTAGGREEPGRNTWGTEGEKKRSLEGNKWSPW